MIRALFYLRMADNGQTKDMIIDVNQPNLLPASDRSLSEPTAARQHN